MATVPGGKTPQARLEPIDDATAAEDPPDGGYGWVIVGAAWLVLFTWLGQVYAYAVWLPVFIEAFDSGEAQAAIVQSLGMSMMTGLGILNGPLMQTVGVSCQHACREVVCRCCTRLLLADLAVPHARHGVAVPGLVHARRADLLGFHVCC
eukprot:COSAG02_NODE_13621_length_1371_cov_1.296384_1_plen_150_part_00